jgi:uncharacterized protein (UPF0262 family)
VEAKRKAQTHMRPKFSKSRLSKAKLDELVEETTVDCYNESEQATGLYTMIEDDLQLPFETQVLGMPVSVIAVDIVEDDVIVAVCQRGGQKQKLPILELPLPTPRPTGSEWIDAYRHWARGR